VEMTERDQEAEEFERICRASKGNLSGALGF
jgi:hypothetical protein